MDFGGRLFTILWLTCAARGLRWSGNLSSDAGTIQICSGQNIQLFWNFTLDRGERLKSMEWGYQPEGEQEKPLATYMDDNFVPAAPFSGRLTHLQGGSIEVSCATILESGNYSIAVSIEASNTMPPKSLTVHHKTATVKVLDTPKTQSGKLHVTRKAEAVRDAISGEWHVQLTCGNFSDRGHPPVDVIWTTPKGEPLQSSSYENGAFRLMLANPVMGGNYSCRILPSQTAMTCLPQDSPLRDKEVVVEVEETVGRLTVLEARQQQMMGQLTADRSHWENVQMDMANRTSVLEQRLEDLHNFESATVSFHAKLANDTLLSTGSILNLTTVISNQGGGYSPLTGYFTAPVNGTYFLIGTTGASSSSSSYMMSLGQYNMANMRLMREGSAICDTYLQMYSSYYSMGSCHGVVYLSAGERVWLQSSHYNSYFSSRVTTFSGFRIN